MNQQSLKVQWTQLTVLSGVHFLVDMLGNMIPAILPVLLKEYGITLLVGVSIPILLSLAANGVQIVTGRMRSDKTTPLFLHVGMILAASICLIALAPRSSAGIVLLFVFGVVSGTGVAVAHPEALRAVHTLNRISPSLSTAVFMTTGFFGFACGGMISALLVSFYGLDGLFPLVVLPVAGIIAVALSRVRLSADGHAVSADGGQPIQRLDAVPFWKVLLIGVPAGVSTTIVQQLAPTYLHEMGFDLTFGGFSTAVFGWGGAVGPFLWAVLAHKKGDLPCSVWAFLLSVPFMVLYLIFDDRPAAAWLLFGVGFSSMSAYILTVTLAREAKGLNLGHRMALIVGGTWGISMLVYLVFAAVADLVGTEPVLKLTPAGYLLSAIFAYYVLRQHPESVRRFRELPAVGLPGGERVSA
ncbi:MAG: MFS transporter [Sedimentisphaerales bacterium]|nr:MFS transporter [Sedimentisphaerales bacterium]